MNRDFMRRWGIPSLDLAARIYLGGVFLFAAWGKVLDPYSFAVNIATYQVLPLELVNLAALILPWVELAVGGLLILGVFTRAQALLVNGMLLVFIAAIASALYRELDLGTCGCFASEEAAEDLSMSTVWRDVAWLAIGAGIFIVPERLRWGVERWWKLRSARNSEAVRDGGGSK
ncbi:MAG: DoxX family membrane protein [Deltaproteobacteria bacterium]|nr:DoxX family membrane protein [Deltaproteobacteria bacterium]